MAKLKDEDAQRKRQKIQEHFWDIVGAVEHTSLPKVKAAVRREFNTEDDRFVDLQLRLMESEGRMKVQSNVKVWIKQPPAS